MLMLEHSARPVQGADDGEFYWTRVTRFGDDLAAITYGIIAERHAAGVDPEHAGIGMAVPGDVEFRLVEDALPSLCAIPDVGHIQSITVSGLNTKIAFVTTS